MKFTLPLAYTQKSNCLYNTYSLTEPTKHNEIRGAHHGIYVYLYTSAKLNWRFERL